LIIAQNESDTLNSFQDAPKVYLDCEHIDFDYVRRNINFVNYVRERQLADIFVLGVSRRTAGGGREYTLTFDGNNKFLGSNDTLSVFTTRFDTEEILRKKLTKVLKLGLMQYVLETPIAERLSFELEQDEETIEDLKDKWDFWVFRMRLSGGFSGEQSRDNYEISGSFNADRITEDWKIRFDADVSYSEESFDIEEEDISWKSSSRYYDVDLDIIKSISTHFSIGTQLQFTSSTYRNLREAYEFSPAIEYSVFPYSESIYREIRLDYFIGLHRRIYDEVTIYEKKSQNLTRHGLSLNLEYKQSWGEIEIKGEYSNYFHDLSKSRFEFYGSCSINMFEGFSFHFGGGYSKIKDQLSLPKRDLDIEEILLSRAELATQYSYYLSFGLSYSFGAIFNNIVNPRFGN
jgi:hypothetical protein